MKVDLSYLKNMSAGNKDLVLEMIDIFKNQVIEFSRLMDQHFRDKEYEQLGRLAHKAKSSILIMGLSGLAAELKNFENLAKAGEKTETYPVFIESFKKQTGEALAELDDVVKNIHIYL